MALCGRLRAQSVRTGRSVPQEHQGAFRNPLVDPYLLGSAAGAGLGATLAIVAGATGAPLPIAAFVGALAAVAMTYVLGASADRGRSTASLVLAGVAVTSFLTAVQTYVQLRNSDVIREVYSWILGRLITSDWHDVAVLTPYVVASSLTLWLHRRQLDVLAVGDDEAATLSVSVQRTRIVVVVAATLGTAAAVSVSGLIAFVGIIVPHTIRLLAGRSYRTVMSRPSFGFASIDVPVFRSVAAATEHADGAGHNPLLRARRRARPERALRRPLGTLLQRAEPEAFARAPAAGEKQ